MDRAHDSCLGDPAGEVLVSNVGQAVLTIVGTVVGAYFGNPELGFALGSLAGSALFPTQLPSGPKLTDNRTTTASLGEPVPIVFGTASVAGTVIWLGPSVQTTNNTNSKGGPNQQTYQYNQSIAIGLCESPVDLQTAIAGLLRVWENGTLVYDIRPQQSADTATGTVAETDQEYAQRLEASATYAETFVLYVGSEIQEPDPTIEGIEGIGNVQPFLGLAYIVYPNRLLQTSQGWRHPNFQFEVFQSGTGDCTTTTKIAYWQSHPWLVGACDEDPTNPLNINTFQIATLDTHGPGYAAWVSAGGPGSGVPPNGLTVIGDALLIGASVYGYDLQFVGYSFQPQGSGGIPTDISCLPSGDFRQLGTPAYPESRYHAIQLHFNAQKPNSWTNYAITGSEDRTVPPTLSIYTEGALSWYRNMWTVKTFEYQPNSDPGPSAIDPWFQVTRGNGGGDVAKVSNWFMYTADFVVHVFRDFAPPSPLCDGLPDAADPEYCVDPSTGNWIKKNAWELVPGQGSGSLFYYVLQVGSGFGFNGSTPPLGPIFLQSDPSALVEATWVNAYNVAVSSGEMDAGLVYGTDYPKLVGANVYQVDYTVCNGAGSQARVSDIIRAVCGRAGITDIDVTDMQSISVDGYPISALSSAASIIDPLRSVAFFDAVESGLTIRFQSRGKDIVRTLTMDDIGAYDGTSAGANVPPSIQTVRSLDSDLPKQIRLHYNSVQRDYQPGEQDSPSRPTSIAVNPVDVAVPIALGDTQALQASEINWADAWNGRTQHTIFVGTDQSELEDGDAIALPIAGFTERVRIIKGQNSGGVLRKLTCVTDDARSYISTAVAPPSGFNPPKITLICPTMAYLMDLPALRDADASAGFYVAASRIWSSGNAWRGATFYKSVDGGVTWPSPLFSIVNETTAGTLVASVAESGTYTWDTSTIIEVLLPDDSLAFESITDDAVLAGGNAAAMGSDGRWEIVQFGIATKVATKRWNLSRLLRGRRGTEHVLGSSHIGDAFVLLVTGNLMRVPLNTGEIGNLDDYKAISIGASFSSADALPFTGRGVALKPFSPVRIDAHYQTDGDILISWTRRDKLGRTLMSGVDIPNTDPPLSFQIDILEFSPNSPEHVIRTLTTSTTSVIYSAAHILSDFGSSGPASLRVAVYQMSAVLGRGTPGNALIDLGDSP